MTLTLVTARTAPARARVGSARRDAPRPLRLTRRGRVVVVSMLVGGGLAVSLAVGGVGRAGTQAEEVPVHWVSVAPGDTLWGIAQQAAPEQDPRDLIVRIRALNGLPDSSLRPGRRLAVPGR